MFKIARFLRKFARDERGVTSIEYGLIAALIAVAVVAVTGDIGEQLVVKFNKILTELTAA